MLIKPMYRGTIDTSEDMLRVSARLAIPKGSATQLLVEEDPRPAVQKLHESGILAPQARGSPFPDLPGLLEG